MKFIDLFSGIGAFRHAFDKLGLQCVFSSEIDENAKNMYKALYGDKEIAGDITQVGAMDIPDHDILVSGIPCQPFSQEGKKEGFSDIRGTLFFDVYRIAKEKRPKYIIIENVIGLLSNNKRNTITTICEKLSELDYSVDFTIYSSLDFGLPQQRSRVFLIGVLNTKEEEWKPHDIKNINTVKKVIKEKSDSVKSFNYPFPTPPKTLYNLSDILERDESLDLLSLPDYFLKELEKDLYRIRVGTKLGYQDFVAVPYHTSIDYAFLKSKSRRGRVKQGVIRTLDTQPEIGIYTGTGFRRITPLETLRAQGFSDEAYDALRHDFSERQIYIRAGNTVSIPIAEAIGESLISFEQYRTGLQEVKGAVDRSRVPDELCEHIVDISEEIRE